MKTYKILGLALAGMLTLSSCNGDLDIAQKGVIPTDQYYKTDDEVEAGATNIYAKLHDMMTDYLMVKNCLSDDCYSGGRGMSSNELNEFTFNASNQQLTSLFREYYDLIYACNLVINHSSDDTPSKRRNIAEAKFFRGWAYFELVTLWGPAPLVLEDERTDYKAPNSTVDALWQQVTTDLTDAAADGVLPSKQGVDDKDTPVRITHEAAEAMLGKALVFQGKYSEANPHLDEVINSGLYAMLQLDQDGYLDYSSYRYDNNSEVLMQVNRLNDPANYGMELSCMYFGLPANNFGNNTNPKSPFFTESWGFTSAALEGLVKAFQDNAKKNGVEDVRYTSTLNNTDQIKEKYGLTLMQGRFFEDCCGYFLNKLASLNENHIPMTWAGFQQNTCIMRYAEVLLLAAESHLQTGDNATALRLINIIRQHAGEPAATSVTLDDIKLEKRLELCLECVRYQDLQRWGDAYEAQKDQGKRIGYYGYGPSGNVELWYPVEQPNAGYQKGRNELLPFPQNEMNVNPNIKQNPGY